MNRRRRARAVAAALMACTLMVAVAACGEDNGNGNTTQTAGEEATSSEPATDVVVGHVSPNLSNPTLGALELGQERAADALGWSLRTVDAGLSPEKQVNHLDTLMNLEVDAITDWTLDPGSVESSYQRIANADIPLVGFNSPSQYFNTNVETELSSSCDPFAAEAAYIAERIPGAKVLMVGPPPVPALEMRLECFESAAKEEGLNILERQDNLKDTSDSSQAVVQNMLTAHSDAEAIWSYNDPSALGAAAALQTAGEQAWSGDTEGVIVIGNNGDPDAIAAIEDGTMTLTYDENTFQAGVEAIKALEPVLAEGEPVSAMPKDVFVESIPYDAENIEDFVPNDQREVEIGE